MSYTQIYLQTKASLWGTLGCIFLVGLSVPFPSLQEGLWALALMVLAIPLFLYRFSFLEWRKFKKRLSQRNLKTYSPQKFFKLLNGHRFANSFLLGDGFAWSNEHCQAVHDLTTEMSGNLSNLSKEISASPKGGQGAGWIQALSAPKNILLPESEIFQHALLAGCSGSGKTSALIALIAQAIAKDMCVLVIDPKGDNALFRSVQNFCTIAKREFNQFRLGHLEEATPINLLANFSSFSEVAARIGQILPGETNDPFRKMGEAALRAVSGGLDLLGEKPTFKSLYDGLTNRMTFANCVMAKWLVSQGQNEEELSCGRTSCETFDTLVGCCDQLDEKPSELTALIDYARKSDERIDKTISAAKDFLAQLTVGELGSLLSPSPSSGRNFLSIRKLIERNSVFYLGTDALQDVSLARALSSLFLTDLASTAGDIYNYECGKKRKVLVVVDEASEACCEALTSLLSKARGAGIGLVLATQSLEDFTARLGSNSEKNRVLANISTRIVMRLQDTASCQFFSDQVARTSIKTRSRTRTAANTSENLLLDGVSIGDRENVTIGVPMIAPDLYARLPKGEAFVICQGGRIFKIRIPFIHQNEEHHD